MKGSNNWKEGIICLDFYMMGGIAEKHKEGIMAHCKNLELALTCGESKDIDALDD